MPCTVAPRAKQQGKRRVPPQLPVAKQEKSLL